MQSSVLAVGSSGRHTMATPTAVRQVGQVVDCNLLRAGGFWYWQAFSWLNCYLILSFNYININCPFLTWLIWNLRIPDMRTASSSQVRQSGISSEGLTGQIKGQHLLKAPADQKAASWSCHLVGALYTSCNKPLDTRRMESRPQ